MLSGVLGGVDGRISVVATFGVVGLGGVVGSVGLDTDAGLDASSFFGDALESDGVADGVGLLNFASLNCRSSFIN